jgi:NAD(P)-dependent dehydrogenase (short-subunit alcohol dehydrogenase family)
LIAGDAAMTVASTLNEFQSSPYDETYGANKRAVGIQTDITVQDSVQLMVNSTLHEFDRLDILVNSAAMNPKVVSKPDIPIKSSAERLEKLDPFEESFEDFPLENWHHALDVNLTGMFLCCQAAGKQMMAQKGGVVVNLCSIYGLVGPDQRIYQVPGDSPHFKPVYYSASKAGVLGLTRYLATYYRGKGIRVNALTPGGIFNQQDDAFVQGYAERTLLGRMAEKSEMNGALLFLASDASSYMTGANLIVDGGWTAW